MYAVKKDVGRSYRFITRVSCGRKAAKARKRDKKRANKTFRKTWRIALQRGHQFPRRFSRKSFHTAWDVV
jgi:hypothetical protein